MDTLTIEILIGLIFLGVGIRFRQTIFGWIFKIFRKNKND